MGETEKERNKSNLIIACDSISQRTPWSAGSASGVNPPETGRSLNYGHRVGGNSVSPGDFTWALPHPHQERGAGTEASQSSGLTSPRSAAAVRMQEF